MAGSTQKVFVATARPHPADPSSSILKIRRADGAPLTEEDRHAVIEHVSQRLRAFRDYLFGILRFSHLDTENNKQVSRPSVKWFDGMEKAARIILQAKEIADTWLPTRPGDPPNLVRPEVLRFQKAIAAKVAEKAKKGRRALKRGNKQKASFYAAEITHLWGTFMVEPERRRGQLVGEGAREAGKARRRQTPQELQHMADEVWRHRPHFSNRSVAKILADKLHISPETVRKAIRKPQAG